MKSTPAILPTSLPGCASQPFNPPAFFAHKDRLARWSLMAVLVLGVAQALTLLLVFRLATRPPWIATVGPGGSVWGDYAQSLAEAKAVQVEQTLLVTHALLQRTGPEFDWPELLEARFAPAALAAALALKADEAQEFRDKAISQKVHVRQVRALHVRPDAVRVAALGKLERRGTFHQQAVTELVPFTLTLNLQLNPDLLGSRRHPLLVTEFQLQYEDAN